MTVKLRIAHKPDKPPVPSLCAGCSSPIAPDATFCESCHAPIVRKYCAGCSRLIPENSISCPYCGTSRKIKPRESNRQLSNVWIFLIVGIILAYFLSGGFIQQKSTTPLASAPAQPTSAAPAPKPQKANPPKKASTVPVSNPQPVQQSDEQGTKLNIEGYTLIQKGDYQNAEAVLRQAVQAFPHGTSAIAYKFALYNLGHVLRRTGRPKEALTYLEKAARLDPEWEKAQSELTVARQQAANTKVL